MSDFGDGHSHDGDGPSFADTFFGVELAASLTGHQISLADAAALSLGIGLAMEHGASGPGHGYETASLGEALDAIHPAIHGPDGPTLPYDPLSRQVALPGIARDNSAVQVLFWPHTPCDPQAQLGMLASRSGLLRYYADPRHQFKDIDRTEGQILFGELLPGQGEERQPPSGWYAGASGSTHLWREFYRIPPASSSWLHRGPTDFETQRTFLIVFGVTWHYRQTNDDETRVLISIYAGKYVDDSGTWVTDLPMVTSCRKHAERLAEGLLRYLQEHRAPPSAAEQRRRLAAGS